MPILRHERARVRDVALSYWKDSITIRDERYRLVSNRTQTVEELYDLSEDLDNSINLALRNRETIERLRKLADSN